MGQEAAAPGMSAPAVDWYVTGPGSAGSDFPVRSIGGERVSPGPREPESVPGPKVFITYRREETGPHAGRLYDAMVARFGEDNVFMDVDM